MTQGGGLARRRNLFRAAALAACLLALLPTPGSGYTLLRTTSFTAPPAFWPVANLPLPMRINPAGSDNVPGSSDTDAIVAGQATWNRINTDYFIFAAPTVAAGTALNQTDGINSIFFDETGANFGAGSSAIAFTALNINGATGVISDADLLFNGTLTFSTANPTPVTMPPTYDIQSIVTHELGHVASLDHSGLVSAVMFPIGSDGAQFARNLTSDDRLGDSFLYPETSGGAGMVGLQAGDGDLNQTSGKIAGFVRTSGGIAVPGAHLVALDANGATVVSDVSRPDGSYLLTGLFPGSYQVYAEPLDGVTLEQDLSQSDHMNAFTLFNATFLGGNATPSTVVVTAGATSSGNVVNLGSLYGVETEANNTFGAANPTALGALMSGVANPATDVDYFSFTTATTGDFINIDVDSSGDACPLDPVVTLYSTNGTTVLSSNDDFDQKGNDSRIAFHLAASGTYFVKVADFGVNPNCPDDGPGSFYTLHVNKAVPETEANNTRATASGAALGQYRGGIISGVTDTDYYSFTASFGDRLIADVSANRAGSPLNPALTLLDAVGATLASCTDISASDLDCVIDFTFTNQAPATFYVQVTAQAGSGASSYYVLQLGTDSLNVLFSAINTLGQGLGGSWAADIFPKFVSQGTGFDLIAAGTGFPLDVTLSVPGPGVTLTPSAGTDFGTNPQGFDFFAMSASVAGSAAPGPRPIFGQNATLKAALSGGLVITPAGVPPEVATASGPLIWSGGQMVWAGNPSANSYNVYRGNLSGLVDLDHNGTADNYGSSFACGITSPLVADPGVPAVGNGFFYLVAGVNVNGEGSLGFTRTNAGPGPERPKSALTGPCP